MGQSDLTTSLDGTDRSFSEPGAFGQSQDATNLGVDEWMLSGWSEIAKIYGGGGMNPKTDIV